MWLMLSLWEDGSTGTGVEFVGKVLCESCQVFLECSLLLVAEAHEVSGKRFCVYVLLLVTARYIGSRCT